MQQFKETIKEKFHFKGCIINLSNNNYNNDYLYLYFKEENVVFENDSSKGNFIIIDLLNRKIIKKIKLNKHVQSILNWNNKNLILRSDKSFYIFDTRINKIISRYSNFPDEDEGVFFGIKIFFSIKNNFYLFAAKRNIMFIFLIKC